MQQQLKDIEIQIWGFLDGACGEADKQHVQRLISSNEVWQKKYVELKALQSQLQEMEKHHPSMRFTVNAMDKIATAQVASTTAHYLNNWVVKGITAFFLILMGAMIIFSIAAINTSASNTSVVDIQKYFNHDVLKITMFINVILALMLTDKLLTRQRLQNRSV